MNKYVTTLNGKKFTVEEILTWSEVRLTQNFDKEWRANAVAKSKANWLKPGYRDNAVAKSKALYLDNPERRAILSRKAKAQTNTEEYKANLRAKWADPKFKARVVAKVKATIAKKRKDPEWVAANYAKRAATIAAKRAENPNWDKEREAKWKKTLAKSKKWQKFLKQSKTADTRRKLSREVLLAKDPDYFKKRTAKFLATQKANGGHWTKRKSKAD